MANLLLEATNSPQERKLAEQLHDSPFCTLISAFHSRTDPIERRQLCVGLIEVASRSRLNGGSFTSILRLISSLASQRMFRYDWRLRRALGHVLGEAVTSFSGEKACSRVLRGFYEANLANPQQSILLTTAMGFNLQTAQAFGVDTLKQLSMHTHPQVRWQLMRRYGGVYSHLSNSRRILCPGAGEIGPWLRRRSIMNSMFDLRHNASRNRIARLTRDLQFEEETPDGVRCSTALRKWLQTNSDINLNMGTPVQIAHGQRSIEALCTSLGAASEPQHVIDFVAALELHCVNLEMQATASSVPISIGSSDEGKYGAVKSWVSGALTAVNPDLKGTLIQVLLTSFDEGIQWAVSSLFREWFTEMRDRESISRAVTLLLQQEHAWSLREAFDQLAENAWTMDITNATDFLSECASAHLRCVASGWSEEELYPSLLRIRACFPDLKDTTFPEHVRIPEVLVESRLSVGQTRSRSHLRTIDRIPKYTVEIRGSGYSPSIRILGGTNGATEIDTQYVDFVEQMAAETKNPENKKHQCLSYFRTYQCLFGQERASAMRSRIESLAKESDREGKVVEVEVNKALRPPVHRQVSDFNLYLQEKGIDGKRVFENVRGRGYRLVCTIKPIGRVNKWRGIDTDYLRKDLIQADYAEQVGRHNWSHSSAKNSNDDSDD